VGSGDSWCVEGWLARRSVRNPPGRDEHHVQDGNVQDGHSSSLTVHRHRDYYEEESEEVELG
jgi:hypothetical protein